MPTSTTDKFMEILIQVSQDSAATKQAVETLAQQNEEIFNRMRQLEEYKATEQGKSQGRNGIISPICSAGAALLSALAAYYSTRGGFHI